MKLPPAVLLNFDLAGAEWFIVAFEARDRRMIDVYESGKSPHIVTGSFGSGLPEDTVKLENKIVGDTSDPDEIADLRSKEPLLSALKPAKFIPRSFSIRQTFKKANHGLNYRQGYSGFALTNEMNESEARTICTMYSGEIYTALPDWWESIDRQVKKDREMTNFFGRKCPFMGPLNNDLFEKATAFGPQSTIVDIVNRSMSRFYADHRQSMLLAELLTQVHDSLLFQFWLSEAGSDLGALNMLTEFIIQFHEHMRPKITLHGRDFYINVEMKMGLNWGRAGKDAKVFSDDPGMQEIKLSTDPRIMRDRLAEHFEMRMREAA